MKDDVDVAAVARLIGNPARATMLDLLLDGRAHSAGELAREARVAPSTASSHLADLLDGALVRAERVVANSSTGSRIPRWRGPWRLSQSSLLHGK